MVDAEIPPKNLSIDWDADSSAPDPFVIVNVGTTYQSAVRDNTYTPVWDVDLAPSVSTATLMGGIAVEMEDEDIAIHDAIGSCTYYVSEAELVARAFEVECPPAQEQAGFIARFELVE
jgi:hypothetical protein